MVPICRVPISRSRTVCMWRASCLEGSLSLFAFISWIFLLSSLPCIYHDHTFPVGEQFMYILVLEGSENDILVRASDMQDMGLWRRNHLCDENKSVCALFGQPSFPFQSCTRLRVFPSTSALAPFLGGSSDETVRFQRSSSPARVADYQSLPHCFQNLGVGTSLRLQ